VYYRIIQSKFGQLDRTNFKRELLQNTEAEDLKPIRNSLFELTRQNGDCLLRESRLVERTNREHGASIEVKLSDDIYLLFHYLEGTYTIADLKPLLSRSRRNTNTQNDNEDSNIHDVVNKLTNKGINPNNSFVLAAILELKQSFNENIQSIGDKLETLSKKFEDEKKMIKQEIMSKESEITQLKAVLQEEKHANGRLRADIKLKSQNLKVQEEKVRATEEQRQNVLTRIAKLLSVDLISSGIVFTICTDCSVSLLRMGRLRVSFPFSCVGSLAGHSLAEYFTESLYERMVVFERILN
jgi:Skp family chaperone for outer membrane proteins